MTAAERVAHHEASHGALFECSGVPVLELVLEERGTAARGHAAAEDGHGPIPGVAMLVPQPSRSDRRHASTAAARAVAPGRSEWEAQRHPHYEALQAEWTSSAARFLDDHASAVTALARALMRQRRLSGDEVRDILRAHGAPTSR